MKEVAEEEFISNPKCMTGILTRQYLYDVALRREEEEEESYTREARFPTRWEDATA